MHEISFRKIYIYVKKDIFEHRVKLDYIFNDTSPKYDSYYPVNTMYFSGLASAKGG